MMFVFTSSKFELAIFRNMYRAILVNEKNISFTIPNYDLLVIFLPYKNVCFTITLSNSKKQYHFNLCTYPKIA